MKVRKILPVLLCVCFLMGCANSVTETETEANSVQAMKQTTAISAADINYEVPKDVPKILVNQVGYKPGNDKVAVFRGENLPSVFRIINVETGECAYTGVIEPGKYNEELQEYNSYGDFSKFQESGTYYIMADVIGMSYPFNIAENVYDPVLHEAFRGYADYIEKAETYTMCEELAVLLLSFELYRSGYTDDMNIPESGNGIPDILDLVKKTTERLIYRQNELTGGVSAGSGMTGENAEASIHFAAVMSKFYTSCKIYDKGYAETCLQAAVKAFDYAQPSFDELDGSLVYFAATELYRATGMAKYASVADAYCVIDNRSSAKGITGYFYGDVTYLSTAFPVDTRLC